MNSVQDALEGLPSTSDTIEILPEETFQTSERNISWYYLCCDPRGYCHRFIALFFMCFLGFGSYFCYDNPAALKDYIKKDVNLTDLQYELLYSMYSWPNVVLCFVGGFLIDRIFGIRLGTNVYMGLTLLGQIIFATGVFWNQFIVMILGRFIFGIGAESLAVAQNNYAVLWFKGKELNMVFGLQLSFARVGSAVNFLVMGAIYQWVTQYTNGAHGLGTALYIATFTCVFSMLCSVVLGALDQRAERLLRRSTTTFSHDEPPVRLMDVKDFGTTFWLLTIICVSYYVAIFPFISIDKDFLITKFHISSTEANYINSVVYLLSAFVSPVFGLIIDQFGRNIFWLITAIISTMLGHSLMAFSMANPFYGMIVIGVAYSCLASSLWPMVSLIIPEHQLGTAYGVCQAVQNLGLAIFTLLAGVINQTYGYIYLEVFFIGSLSVALATALILWAINAHRHGILNMTPGQRVQLQ